MSQISISNLSFIYEGSHDYIFQNVSFVLDTDWKLGFIGRNGRGKTTFLSLLMGRYEYTGRISASTDFQYFPFSVENKEQKTVDIVRNICVKTEKWQIVRELSLLKVGEEVLERQFSTLSNGEQTKVLLASLFLNENSFLLIDEPTNHLDLESRETLSRYLNTKSGYILVSHDRNFLDGCVDHILSLNKTEIELQRGNFSSWFLNKENRDKFELSENEKLTRDIERLKDAAKQSRQWADKVESTKIGRKGADIEKNIDSRAYIGEKSRRMQQRRKNLERRQQTAIEDKTKLLNNIERADELKIIQPLYFKERYLSFYKVSVRYDSREIFTDVTFDIERGDRVLVKGKNGAGKSSILKLVCGQPVPFTGEVNIGSALKISYVPQDTSFLYGNLSVFAKINALDESLFKAILRKLDFERVQFEKDMSEFSAGQKKKVLIAKSLCEQAHLLVWDEPLNYIDLFSRIQIERLIGEYKPTILFVEHDREFCEKLATKTVLLQ